MGQYADDAIERDLNSDWGITPIIGHGKSEKRKCISCGCEVDGCYVCLDCEMVWRDWSNIHSDSCLPGADDL